jgi:hypothetical protein
MAIMDHGGEHLYVIGIGSREDWDAGRGSLYWIEGPNGERALPVFTTPEAAKKHWAANSGVRQRLDMADSVPPTHQGPLLQKRCVVMPLDGEGLALAAARVRADYILRNPRPGHEQEILRLSK